MTTSDTTHPVTLRDLLRYARSIGAPLRRVSHDPIMTEYWQFWDEGAHRRRALVRRWPNGSGGTWRIEIYGDDTTNITATAVRVDLQNPTIEQITDAARLCGWPVP